MCVSSHLFNGVQFLCGKDHFARKILLKHLGFETNEAVVHGLVSWVSDVCRCAMWKTPCCSASFDSGRGIFIRRDQH